MLFCNLLQIYVEQAQHKSTYYGEEKDVVFWKVYDASVFSWA